MALTGKKILITGGAGFIGSHLCEALVKEGNTVISLDNYFTGSRENHVAGVLYREGHTKDIATLIPETDIDIIYHLGEYARVAQSMEEPALVWDLNILGTLAVLEFWRARKCKLVYAGSSTKFAEKNTEDILGRDLSPYTWAKASNSDLVRNYGEWYELPYAICYFYNVYGPRERSGTYGTVIQIFSDRMKNGETLKVNGPGTQSRIYTHVLDTVSGLILVGEKGEQDEYGIGSEDDYPILEVAKMFGGTIEMMPHRKTSRPSAVVDTSKIRALGWKPEHSLRDYIEAIKGSNS